MKNKLFFFILIILSIFFYFFNSCKSIDRNDSIISNDSIVAAFEKTAIDFNPNQIDFEISLGKDTLLCNLIKKLPINDNKYEKRIFTSINILLLKQFIFEFFNYADTYEIYPYQESEVAIIIINKYVDIAFKNNKKRYTHKNIKGFGLYSCEIYSNILKDSILLQDSNIKGILKEFDENKKIRDKE